MLNFMQSKTSKQGSKTQSEIGNIDSYLGYWLRFVSNQVTASFQEHLAQEKVSVAEWITLRFLYSHSPCSLTQLSEEMGMDKGAASRLADRLEQRGLILRNVSSQDRRLFSIELTAAGKKLVPTLAKIADENDAFFFGHLNQKEFDHIVKLLKGIVNRHEFKSKPVT